MRIYTGLLAAAGKALIMRLSSPQRRLSGDNHVGVSSVGSVARAGSQRLSAVDEFHRGPPFAAKCGPGAEEGHVSHVGPLLRVNDRDGITSL
jgi:hypothetical protein